MADVITYIKDTAVFQLKDLTDLYKKQIILHGAAIKDTK